MNTRKLFLIPALVIISSVIYGSCLDVLVANGNEAWYEWQENMENCEGAALCNWEANAILEAATNDAINDYELCVS
mgnify:CR=1 FL=1